VWHEHAGRSDQPAWGVVMRALISRSADLPRADYGGDRLVSPLDHRTSRSYLGLEGRAITVAVDVTPQSAPRPHAPGRIVLGVGLPAMRLSNDRMQGPSCGAVASRCVTGEDEVAILAGLVAGEAGLVQGLAVRLAVSELSEAPPTG